MAKVREVDFLSIGGGIGSFCWVDTLRIHGVPAEKIAVISPSEKPYHQFKAYCDAIGLTKNDRLRSDSGSRPDNFWGFPGYGLTEALKKPKILLQLLFEPFIFGYYSPTAGQVYKALDREAVRISWSKMLVNGKAVSLTKQRDGRFLVECKPKNRVIARVVHLSLGHGKVRNTKNPYKLNDKLLKEITKKGGKVLVIGRGTGAQKIVDKLLDSKKLKVISFHAEPEEPTDSRGVKQKRLLTWRLQQFNWPRAAFGGGLMGQNDYLWSLPSATPDKNWIKKLQKSMEEGRYQIVSNSKNLKYDFKIDCTGFDEQAINHKLYSTLIKKHGLPVNPDGSIKTGEFFEVEKLCSYKGRLFITGPAAGFTGPTDSFFGQQYAAFKTLESLNVMKLDFIESFSGWYKWLMHKKI